MTLFWLFFHQLFYENFCFFGFVHNLLIFSKKEVNGYQKGDRELQKGDRGNSRFDRIK